MSPRSVFLEPVCSKPVRNPSLKEICTRYWPTIYTIYHLNHTDHKVYCVWTCSRSFSVRKKSNRLLKGGTGSPTIPKETDPPGSNQKPGGHIQGTRVTQNGTKSLRRPPVLNPASSLIGLVQTLTSSTTQRKGELTSSERCHLESSPSSHTGTDGSRCPSFSLISPVQAHHRGWLTLSSSGDVANPCLLDLFGQDAGGTYSLTDEY